jgi:type IV pilus biogenesis protein CpaD/CtpE
MKQILLTVLVLLLTACASTNWSTRNYQDEFTDQKTCRVVYGTDFGKGIVKGMGGIHYYPFIENGPDGVVFGIHNDYEVPVGDVQIRVDGNSFIAISPSETPLRFSSSAYQIDTSYMKDIEGIDSEAMQNSMKASMENVQKMSSPYTATAGEKAEEIISQLRVGKMMKMRIIGFGVNSVASTTGEYTLGEDLRQALAACGI